MKQRSMSQTESKNINDLRGDGSFINSWVAETCRVKEKGTGTTSLHTPKTIYISLSVSALCHRYRPMCVCVCVPTQTWALLIYTHTHTGLCTPVIGAILIGVYPLWCLSFPRRNRLTASLYSLLWWWPKKKNTRQRSVWMWQLLFISPSVFLFPHGKALSHHMFML